MNAKPLVSIAPLLVAAFSGSIAASEPTNPAWQEPGYVMEVVIAKAPRPSATNPETSADAAPLAWQEPGYVEEVVVVTASRSEAEARAAALREALQRRLQRSEVLGTPRR